MLLTVACKKSSDDPENKTVYTTEYSVVSSANGVAIDTIIYRDKSGNDIILTDQLNLSESFTTENGYDAYLYVSGETSNNGICEYYVGIKEEGAAGFIKYDGKSSQSTQAVGFKFTGKFSYSSSK